LNGVLSYLLLDVYNLLQIDYLPVFNLYERKTLLFEREMEKHLKSLMYQTVKQMEEEQQGGN